MRGKPSIFSKPNGNRASGRRKLAAESAFRAGALPKSPPAELRGLPAARAAWRRLLEAHDQLPGEVFNVLDRGFFVGYCLAVQARQNALKLEQAVAARYAQDPPAAELKDLLAVRVELRQATRLVSDLEKQMFATPKARGGVNPPARQASPQEIIAEELAALDRELGRSPEGE